MFVSEIGPNRVWKFNIHRDSQTHRKDLLLFQRFSVNFLGRFESFSYFYLVLEQVIE